MANCGRYELKLGNKVETFLSEEEMNKFIEQHYVVLSNLVDMNEDDLPEINFSKELSKKSEVDVVFKKMNNELVFNETNHTYHLGTKRLKGSTEFIDEYRDVNGNRLVPEFIKENYEKRLEEQFREEYAKELKSDDSTLTEDDILQMVDDKFKLFDSVKEIGTSLHKVSEEFFKEEFYVDNEDDALAWLEINEINNIQPKVLMKYVEYMRSLKNDLISEYGTDVSFLPEAKIFDKESEIAGMVDLVVVTPEGKVVIIDYKTSYKDIGKWSHAKNLKIGYQQTLYKRILENRGIEVESMKIAPFHLTDIDASNGRLYDAKDDILTDVINLKGSSVGSGGSVDANVDIIVPKKYKLKDDEVNIDNTISFLQNVFDYNIDNYSHKRDIDKFMERKVEFVNGKYVLHYYDFDNNERATKEYDTESKARKGAIEYLKVVKRKALKFPSGVQWMADHIQKDKNPPINISSINKKVYKLLKQEYPKSFKVIKNSELEKLGICALHDESLGIIDFLIFDPNTGDRVHLDKGTTLLGKFKDDSIKDKFPDILNSNTSNIEAMKIASFLNNNPGWAKDNKIRNIIVLNTSDEMRFVSYNTLKNNYKYILNNVGKEVADEKYQLDNVLSKTPMEELGSYLNKLLTSATEDSFVEGELKKYVSNFRTVQGVKNPNAIRDMVNEIITNIYKKTESGEARDLTSDQLELTRLCAVVLADIERLDISSIKEITTFIKQGSTPGKTGSKFLDGYFRIMERAILASGKKLVTISNENKVDLKKYIKDSGFNLIMTGSDKLYNNMFNEKTMRFKDPDDRSNNLSETERTYLRKYLEKINDIRFKGDKKIIEKEKMLKERYLDMPIMRRTRESHLQKFNVKGFIKEYLNDLVHFKNEVLKDDSEFYSKTKNTIEMYNMFEQYEGNSSETARKKLFDKMSEKDNDLKLEVNLEVLLLSFAHSNALEEEGNKVLPLANAFKSLVHWKKSLGIDLKNVEEFMDYTTKFMLFNDPNLSIADRKAKGILGTARKLASTLNMTLNPLSGVREFVTGSYINATRILAYKGMDHAFGADDLAYAYKRVIGDAKDALSLDNISFTEHLNEQFGITMMDTDSIKTMVASTHAKKSVFKSKYMYMFNIMPDFMHRSVYFIAKMHKDGVIAAYEKDGKGGWKYNPKKDGRFSAYLTGKTTHPEYGKQKALYEIIKAELIKDGEMGENQEFIPTPYTIRERGSIKDLSDSVLGNYDRHSRTKFSNTVFGSLIMQFATWMTAVKDRYWLKSGVYKQGKYAQVIRKDDQGNDVPIFIDKDGNETTEDTGEPAMYWQGHMQEGILQTLGSIYRNVLNGDQSIMEMLKSAHDPQRKANMIFLATDLLTLLIAYALASLFLSDEFRKDSPLQYKLAQVIIDSGKDISGINSILNKSIGDGQLISSAGTIKQIGETFRQAAVGDPRVFETAINNIGLARPIVLTYKEFNE